MSIHLSSRLHEITSVDSPSGRLLAFWCPGCEQRHAIGVEGSKGPKWSWNGDAEKPVFQPSILVRGIRQDMTDEELELYDKVVEKVGTEAILNDRRFGTVCHSFVGCNGAQPGQITFLGDCTHKLANQTVDLPDIPKPKDYNE